MGAEEWEGRREEAGVGKEKKRGVAEGTKAGGEREAEGAVPKEGGRERGRGPVKLKQRDWSGVTQACACNSEV